MIMGNTPYYGFSYPEPPGHTRTWEYWQTQVEQIENLLKNGFRIPTGNLILGEPASTPAYALELNKTEGGNAYRLLLRIGTGGLAELLFLKNGVEVNRFRLHNDGNIRIEASTQSNRVLPYAMAAGAANVTTSTGAGFVTITFAAGRFSAVPVVQCTGSDHHFNWSSLSQTTSGFTAWMRNLDGTSSPNYSVNVFWQATQMLAAIGPYLASRQADYETVMVQAICHTAGCDNEGVPIVIDVPLIEGYDPLDSNIQCGPCGEPIDDISLPTT